MEVDTGGRFRRRDSVPVAEPDQQRRLRKRCDLAGMVGVIMADGYCQSGQIMATVAFLKDFPSPTDADIDANITNICRCGTYERLRRAIHRAADMMKA